MPTLSDFPRPACLVASSQVFDVCESPCSSSTPLRCAASPRNMMGSKSSGRTMAVAGSLLGFPCNQFGDQEHGQCGRNRVLLLDQLHVTFPMFAKVEVNGPGPIRSSRGSSGAPGFLGTEAIKWNFTKFLVDRSGKSVKRYAPTVEPASIAGDIEKLL